MNHPYSSAIHFPLKYGFAHQVSRPFRELLQTLSQPELKKTLLLGTLSFLLAMGLYVGFFAANALLIHRLGSSPLLYVYSLGSLSALLLAGVFLFLVRRFPHSQVYYFFFWVLGLTLVGIWVVLTRMEAPSWIYIAVRAFFYAVYILTNLQFWLIAGDYFTHFEARRRFPFLAAAWISGLMIAGVSSHYLAPRFHAVNFILVWGLILLVFPPFILTVLSPLRTTEKESPPSPENSPLTLPLGESKKLMAIGLTWILFIFWLFYSFSSFSIDYVFNTEVRTYFSEEDNLAAFYGKIGFFAGLIILAYQGLLARRLTFRFGVDRLIFLIPLFLSGAWALIYFFPSLVTLSLAQIGIFYFADSVAGVLLQPIWSVYPQKRRGAAKSLAEGFGRPAGALVLLTVALFASFHLPVKSMSFFLLGVSLLFLAYPFLFHRVYLNHLLTCLHSRNPHLISNAIQALGERNKKKAAGPLLKLLAHTKEIALRRTIVLSLGQMQSREAFRTIVDLFSVRDESIQIAVLESLGHFKNYESIAALFQLMKSKKNVSFQVRRNATFILTRLMGKKMIPFLLNTLEDSDPRMKANVIESIGLLKDRKTMGILLPFLGDENHRIGANAAIALYPFRRVRKQVLAALEGLFNSPNKLARLAALYAIGVLRLKNYEKDLLPLLHASDKRELLHASAALAKMKSPVFSKVFRELLLDPDEGLALEAIRQMGQFPRFSRLLLFEEIGELPPKEKKLILSRLDQTPFDFSAEKEMLAGEKQIVYPAVTLA